MYASKLHFAVGYWRRLCIVVNAGDQLVWKQTYSVQEEYR